MVTKSLSNFWKIIIALFLVGCLMTLVGRNHYLLGSALIIARWLMFIAALFFLYLVSKRNVSKNIKAGLVTLLILIPAEYVWNKINEQKLQESEVTTEVSIMTYNIFFKNKSPKLSVAIIKNVNPDILLVQEITPDWASTLNNAIESTYPYKSIAALKGTHGIGIYSKFPITKSELLKNQSHLPYAQVVELKINQKRVQLINVHLASPAAAVENPMDFFSLFSQNYQSRSKQLDSLHQIAERRKDKFDAQFLVGDLNTTRFEPVYRNIKKYWTNLYDKAGKGNGYNFPNSSKTPPLITIDYIFGNGRLEVHDMKVIKGGSSDHQAIVGKIKI